MHILARINHRIHTLSKSVCITHRYKTLPIIVHLIMACCIVLWSSYQATPLSGFAGAKTKKKKTRTSQQTPEQIQAEQRTLERLSSSIARLKKDIAKAEKTEKKISSKLNLYRRKGDELRTSIVFMERTIDRTEDSIRLTQGTIGDIEKRLTTMQQEYAHISQEIYKQTTAPTSGNSTENARNTKYMQELTISANHMAGTLSRLRDSLSGKKVLLSSFLSRQDQNKSLQEQRKDDLEKTIAKNESTLDQVREDKQEMIRQLQEKNAGAKKVQRLIENLIAKASKEAAYTASKSSSAHRQSSQSSTKISSLKQREEASHTVVAGRTSTSQRLASTDDDTHSNKRSFRRGSLPWPVSNHTIIQPFGSYTNTATNTRMTNPGIGIKASKGSTVEVVADGIVSLVHWLPGYGSLVIVDHRNGFRTVYANLSTVLVTQGQSVVSGTAIGKSGRSVEGEYVHFEVWRQREKLNPKEWLN
jgi:septal ring factor EnvC (AmiA/AmiB activator)